MCADLYQHIQMRTRSHMRQKNGRYTLIYLESRMSHVNISCKNNSLKESEVRLPLSGSSPKTWKTHLKWERGVELLCDWLYKQQSDIYFHRLSSSLCHQQISPSLEARKSWVYLKIWRKPGALKNLRNVLWKLQFI